MYRFFDKCVLRGFIDKIGTLSINPLKKHLSKKLISSLHINSHIYLVSKGGGDILKIVGGVAFYVELFYEKS